MATEAMTRDELENGTPWLHLFAQAQWHDEAAIVGNRKAIENLRDALTLALEHPDGVAVTAPFTTDGEGYELNVYVLPFAEMERMQLPYTDADLFNPNGVKGRMWPCQLPKQPTPEGER